MSSSITSCIMPFDDELICILQLFFFNCLFNSTAAFDRLESFLRSLWLIIPLSLWFFGFASRSSSSDSSSNIKSLSWSSSSVSSSLKSSSDRSNSPEVKVKYDKASMFLYIISMVRNRILKIALYSLYVLRHYEHTDLNLSLTLSWWRSLSYRN